MAGSTVAAVAAAVIVAVVETVVRFVRAIRRRLPACRTCAAAYP